MSVAEALEELKDSTNFLDHLAQLNQAAEDEQRRRERFTEELSEDVKAEFINGRVVVHSPVRLGHLNVSLHVTLLLGSFVMQRDLGMIATEKCFIRCHRNDYEPDVCFLGKAKCHGWDDDKLIFPPPDLVVEILSPSTERNDRTVKLQDYAWHGVGEYWIVDAEAQSIEQYLLPPDAHAYELKAHLSGSDLLTSEVIAGFTVPISAFFDAKENLRTLRALSDLS